MQNNGLTEIKKPATIRLAGQKDAGSAGEQPARDNRLKATICRWDGRVISAIPFCQQRQFRALLCLKKLPKKLPAEGRYCLLSVKGICPIYAEPLQS